MLIGSLCEVGNISTNFVRNWYEVGNNNSENEYEVGEKL